MSPPAPGIGQQRHRRTRQLPGGRRRTAGPESGPVVVGVDGSPISTEAVTHAFQAADTRGTTLVAVHSYGGFAGGAFYGQGEEALRRLNDEAAASLGSQLAGHSEDYPDVEVESAIVAGDAAPAIVGAAAMPN